MRGTCLIIAALVGLVACAPPPPNDGDQYFDNITPDPSALQAENQRLANAENGTATAPATPATTAAVAEVDPNAPATISNTQDFQRIKEKETIESDAAKLAALKQDYQVVQPSDVVVPTQKGGVNLAAYAISQKHAIGTRVFRRFNVGLSNCARYRNDPDGAQRAFLEAGGPERDRRRLDPDGDGFACDWNPDTYRRLLQTSG